MVWRRRRKNHHLCRTAHEAQTEAQHTESLNNRIVCRTMSDKCILRRRLPTRQFPHNRCRNNTLNILTTRNSDIEKFAQPKNHCRYYQTYQEGDEHDHHLTWWDRRRRTQRIFYHTNIGFIDGQLKSHLFTLVQQVSIQSFFEILLTLNIECFSSSLRRIAHLPHQRVLITPRSISLHLHRAHITANRRKNACALWCQLLIEIAH